MGLANWYEETVLAKVIALSCMSGFALEIVDEADVLCTPASRVGYCGNGWRIALPAD